jgi:hypothetical protein
MKFPLYHLQVGGLVLFWLIVAFAGQLRDPSKQEGQQR